MKDQDQKKYELLQNDTIQHNGKTLYRIKALISFGDIKAGNLGGYIQDECNLSHWGNAWVFNNARVYDNAIACDNARVADNARVFGNAWVYGNARVYDNAEVCDNARVYDKARVCGIARVYDNAKAFGNAWVCRSDFICKNAFISKESDVFSSNYVGRENGVLTVYKTENELYATRGCFNGTLDEFLQQSSEVHDERIHKEYKLLIEVARSRILG
ncbi:hypothetical protein [Histophilus somni]|uniref:hypothetical protein n=1 Tax=Histophilus somni TaxID=731 RepID=UPI00094AAF74|nr:hypothetical protein [Histophilus somni]